MHAILATLGTDGDVFPYVAIGNELRTRGHRVTLAAAGGYRDLAADNGLEFAELVSERENRSVLSNPDFWHPLKGPFVAAQWGANFLDHQYDLLKSLAGAGDAVLVASPGILTARLINETIGTPLASVVLQPWMIASSIAPPIMPAKLTLPRWAPMPMAAAYWRIIDATGDLLIGRQLNKLRASLGLAPVRRVFQWWNSPQLILGLFPGWYGPPRKDWLKQIRLCGFPLFDGRAVHKLPADVEQFCRAGPPPIAFTFGTGMMHGSHLFRAAVEACGILKTRGIMLTQYREQLPATLPDNVIHCEFAPFARLFPLCAAIVHHGGVGTVAKALASGTPQLVLPIAFDQLDNATRVKRLGAGDWIRAARATGPRVAAALKQITTDQTAARCREHADRFQGSRALTMAAELIEALAT